jgi:hypothetical protein
MGTGFINESVTDSGNGDAGVFVTVESGNLNLDTIVYDSAYDSYLGKTTYPHVGVNQYPRVSLSLKPATSGDAFMGMTLRQTAKFDENGEKLLYYPQKAEELMCMLPGQSVPIASRGMFTLAASAFAGSVPGVGSGIKLPSGVSGKVTGCTNVDAQKIGTVLATGSRTATVSTANLSDPLTGNYAIVYLGL